MTGRATKFFVAVASADHVARGRQGGFMQACHGKRGPLARMTAGDRILYYSPSTRMGSGVPLQAFTAAGRVRQGQPYAFDMGGGFVPYRRDIDWLETAPAPIRPLLEHLDFTRGKVHWGQGFRYGFFAISEHDHDLILSAMTATQKSANGTF